MLAGRRGRISGLVVGADVDERDDTERATQRG